MKLKIYFNKDTDDTEYETTEIFETNPFEAQEPTEIPIEEITEEPF